MFRLEEAVAQIATDLLRCNLLQVFLALHVTIELLWTAKPVIAVDAVDLGHGRFVYCTSNAKLLSDAAICGYALSWPRVTRFISKFPRSRDNGSSRTKPR